MSLRRVIRKNNSFSSRYICSEEEMSQKKRELKIARLLGEDTKEIESWIESHTVSSKGLYELYENINYSQLLE